MLLMLFELIIGIALLVWSADRFVIGAANIARNVGMNPLLVGVTIVSIGTSAPEIVLAIIAAIHQQTDLIIGNAIGSNIANIGLGIGLIALFKPLQVRSTILRQEYPVLFIGMLLFGLLITDGVLNRLDGYFLLFTFCIAIGWLISKSLQCADNHAVQQASPTEIRDTMSTLRALIWLIIGGILLPISARILVFAAVKLSHHFGISQLVIGLTVVAIGTSLPEIATSFVGALRQEYDIAIGNILGSNIFNILLVLGLPALITPIPINKDILYRDYAVMVGLTLILFVASYSFHRTGRITRLAGGLLLLCYVAYLAILYFQ